MCLKLCLAVTQRFYNKTNGPLLRSAQVLVLVIIVVIVAVMLSATLTTTNIERQSKAGSEYRIA